HTSSPFPYTTLFRSQLLRPQIAKDSGLPLMSPARRAAIVHLPDDKAAGCQRLAPRGSGPHVANHLSVWTTIDHHDRRIFLSGREDRKSTRLNSSHEW